MIASPPTCLGLSQFWARTCSIYGGSGNHLALGRTWRVAHGTLEGPDKWSHMPRSECRHGNWLEGGRSLLEGRCLLASSACKVLSCLCMRSWDVACLAFVNSVIPEALHTPELVARACNPSTPPTRIWSSRSATKWVRDQPRLQTLSHKSKSKTNQTKNTNPKQHRSQTLTTTDV